MISVIVPVYKAEQVISRCIESVIAQEYQDWELILVDDGSPDKSGEICDEYAKRDARISVIHQENKGVSSARNRGLDESRGEYFCFIDSDDYVSPKYLCDFGISDSADLVIQGMTLTYQDITRNHTKKPGKSEIVSLYDLLAKDSEHLNLLQGPCCKLYRKKIIDENSLRFPIGINYGEDSIFLMEYLLYCQREIQLLACSNYFYTHEEGSMSLSSKKQNYLKLYQSIEINYSFYQRLSHKVGGLPQTYIEYYKSYNSFTYYNSLYVLLSSDETYDVKIHFLKSRNKEIQRFFSTVDGLPITYQIIRSMDSFLPDRLFVLLYSFIKRFIPA